MSRFLKSEETGPSGEIPRNQIEINETKLTCNDHRGGKRDLLCLSDSPRSIAIVRFSFSNGWSLFPVINVVQQGLTSVRKKTESVSPCGTSRISLFIPRSLFSTNELLVDANISNLGQKLFRPKITNNIFYASGFPTPSSNSIFLADVSQIVIYFHPHNRPFGSFFFSLPQGNSRIAPQDRISAPYNAFCVRDIKTRDQP